MSGYGRAHQRLLCEALAARSLRLLEYKVCFDVEYWVRREVHGLRGPVGPVYKC